MNKLSLDQLQAVEKIIGYEFQNKDLLMLALTHKSFAHEESIKPTPADFNERLEFLGDSVLSLIVSSDLYCTEICDEGVLSKKRSQWVNETSLAHVARSLGLSPFILMSKGELKSSGQQKDSILASTLEALIGAVYVDSDFENTNRVFAAIWLARRGDADGDYKSELQELIQAKTKKVPTYIIDGEEGPSHQKKFYATVFVEGRALGKGTGKSKQAAERDAAKNALLVEGEI